MLGRDGVMGWTGSERAWYHASTRRAGQRAAKVSKERKRYFSSRISVALDLRLEHLARCFIIKISQSLTCNSEMCR